MWADRFRAIRLAALALVVAACSANLAPPAPSGPLPGEAARRDGGRHAVSYLFLGATGLSDDLVPAARDYLFSAHDAARVTIRLVSTAPGRLHLTADCDGPARFVHDRPGAEPAMGVGWGPPGTPLLAELPPGERLRSRLELDPATTACRLQIAPSGGTAHALTLRREDLARPALLALDTQPAGCAAARPPPGDRLAAAFLAERALAQTCPGPGGAMRLLSDGPESLNAKIEALTGARLPADVLAAGNPDVPLDWSNAPELDLIYVHYLNINADYSGYLIARMLAFHAARGTIVRILVPDLMLTDAERRLFQALAARFPTVQLQPYRVPPSVGRGIETRIGSLHRVSHVKMFAALSRTPGRSVAILGGRNLHDGYVFPAPLDLAAWPFLHQYDPRATRLSGGFAAYVDFEIALHDDAQVRAILSQMGSYWHRDHDSQRLWADRARPPAAPAVSAGPLARHFLSVPYADGQAQEALFVDLIDAAAREIDISSPYLNLTPALEAAFERARDRGVAVRVVATLRVREATEFMVTGLNKLFANRHGRWLRFYDFDPYPQMLHSKLLVFDRRLAVVTSTNLNQRSFLHDTENGVMILDPQMAARIGAVIEGYIARGRPVREGQPVNRLVRLLQRWRMLSRGF